MNAYSFPSGVTGPTTMVGKALFDRITRSCLSDPIRAAGLICNHVGSNVRQLVCNEYDTMRSCLDVDLHQTYVGLRTCAEHVETDLKLTHKFCKSVDVYHRVIDGTAWSDNGFPKPSIWDALPSLPTTSDSVYDTVTGVINATVSTVKEAMIPVSTTVEKVREFYADANQFANTDPADYVYTPLLSFEGLVGLIIVFLQLSIIFSAYRSKKSSTTVLFALISMLLSPYIVGVQMFFSLCVACLTPITPASWFLYPIYVAASFLSVYYKTYWPMFIVMFVLGVGFVWSIYYYRQLVTFEAATHQQSWYVRAMTIIFVFLAYALTKSHWMFVSVVLIYLVLRYIYVMCMRPLYTQDEYVTYDDGSRKQVSHLYVYRGISGWRWLDEYLNPTLGIGLGEPANPDQVERYIAEEVARRVRDRADADRMRNTLERENLKHYHENLNTARNDIRDEVNTRVNAKLRALDEAKRELLQMEREEQRSAQAVQSKVARVAGVGFKYNTDPGDGTKDAPIIPTSASHAANTPKKAVGGASSISFVKGDTLPGTIDKKGKAKVVDAGDAGDVTVAASQPSQPKTPLDQAVTNQLRNTGASANIPVPDPVVETQTQNMKMWFAPPTKKDEAPSASSPFIDMGTSIDLVLLKREDGSFAGTGYFAENRIHTIDHVAVREGEPQKLIGVRVMHPHLPEELLKFEKSVGFHWCYHVPERWRREKITFGKYAPCPVTTEIPQLCMNFGFPENNPFGKPGAITGSVGPYSYVEGEDTAIAQNSSDHGCSGGPVYKVIDGKVSNQIIGTWGGNYSRIGNFFYVFTTVIIEKLRPEPKVSAEVEELRKELAAAKARLLEIDQKAQHPDIHVESPKLPLVSILKPMVRFDASSVAQAISFLSIARNTQFEGPKQDRVKKNKRGRGRAKNLARLATNVASDRKTPAGFNRRKFYSHNLRDWVDYGEADNLWSQWCDYQEQQGYYVDDADFYDTYKRWLSEVYGSGPPVEYPAFEDRPDFYIEEAEDYAIIHDYADRYLSDTDAWDTRERVGKSTFESALSAAMSEALEQQKHATVATHQSLELLRKQIEKMLVNPPRSSEELRQEAHDAKMSEQVQQCARALEAMEERYQRAIANIQQTAQAAINSVKGTPGSLEGPKEHTFFSFPQTVSFEAPIPRVAVPQAHAPKVKELKDKEKLSASFEAEAKAGKQVAQQAFSQPGTPQKRRCPYCEFKQIPLAHQIPSDFPAGKKTWRTLCPNSKEFFPSNSIWSGWSKEQKELFNRQPAKEKFETMRTLAARGVSPKTNGGPITAQTFLASLDPSQDENSQSHLQINLIISGTSLSSRELLCPTIHLSPSYVLGIGINVHRSMYNLEKRD